MSHKTVVLHIQHRMWHAPSLLFPSHLSTSSLFTCTPVRPSTRLSLLSTSHGHLPCADPSNVSFDSLAEPHSPASYEPKDLTEEDSSILVKPDSPSKIGFWTMSKHGTCWLYHCTCKREKHVPTDHEFTTPSEKTQCQVHLNPEKVQEPAAMLSHKRKSSQETLSYRRHFLKTSIS